jgi:chromosome segregation ATPase
MESLFVWIVMSGGVAIALLGAVLFTSERELKTRRREVEELLTKVENMQQGNAPAPFNAPLPDNSAALAELRAANEQLKMELNEVRAQLHASEAQAQGSAEIQYDSSQQQIAQAHNEVGALTEKLNDSQAKIRELENARQNQVDIDALEARHREERQSLGARVAELEREISAGRENLQELEALRAHIAESEQSQKSLREEIQQHEQEAARWQARITEAEANREQLTALQKPYNELLSKHASLAEMQRELQQDLSALARLMGAAATATAPASLSNAFSESVGGARKLGSA